jgi:hypothetical protein
MLYVQTVVSWVVTPCSLVNGFSKILEEHSAIHGRRFRNWYGHTGRLQERFSRNPQEEGRIEARSKEIGTVGRKAVLLRNTIFPHLWEMTAPFRDTIFFWEEK